MDEETLITALQDDSNAGAGIDVFEEEPVTPEHPLLHMDNVIAHLIAPGIMKRLLQHCSEKWQRRLLMFCNEICHLLA